MEHDRTPILGLLEIAAYPQVDVRFFDALGRAVVLFDGPVPDEVRRNAGRRSGWDIEIMAPKAFEQLQEKAVQEFSSLANVSLELAQRLVNEGYLTLDNLSVIDPADLARHGGLTYRQAEAIIEETDERVVAIEELEARRRRDRRRDED